MRERLSGLCDPRSKPPQPRRVYRAKLGRQRDQTQRERDQNQTRALNKSAPLEYGFGVGGSAPLDSFSSPLQRAAGGEKHHFRRWSRSASFRPLGAVGGALPLLADHPTTEPGASRRPSQAARSGTSLQGSPSDRPEPRAGTRPVRLPGRRRARTSDASRPGARGRPRSAEPAPSSRRSRSRARSPGRGRALGEARGSAPRASEARRGSSRRGRRCARASAGASPHRPSGRRRPRAVPARLGAGGASRSTHERAGEPASGRNAGCLARLTSAPNTRRWLTSSLVGVATHAPRTAIHDNASHSTRYRQVFPRLRRGRPAAGEALKPAKTPGTDHSNSRRRGSQRSLRSLTGSPWVYRVAARVSSRKR